jgi:sterol desaturase/sphingolipid hydroxylase (fatty acid hydroxylase superfamily)
MTETQFQLVRTGAFFAAVIAAVVLQRLSPHGRIRRSPATNLGLWVIDVVAVGAVCGACTCTAASWAADRGYGLLNEARLPAWPAIAVTIAGLDLVSYAWHRANHAVPVLWRFHQVHHSDVHYTVSTAARFHPGELLLSLPLRLAAVVALGAPIAGVLAFEIVFALANFMEHGDIDLPASVERGLQSVLVTPALHRLHHARNWSDLNTNFATVSIVWDRLFGTYRGSSSRARIETGHPELASAPGLLDGLVLPARRLGPPASPLR